MIYLDNNATTEPAPAVVAAMRQVLETWWGNPSSVHRFGQQARQRVEAARASLARLLHCREREVLFTSGGTEATNLALRGTLLGRPDKRPMLITARTEHSATRACADSLAGAGVEVAYLPVGPDGLVRPGDLASLLGQFAGTRGPIVVSLQWANNETGVVQPVTDLAEVCRSAAGPVLFHVDATQAVGKIPVDLSDGSIDLLTLAAHKFHGPKGVGALYVRSGVRLQPQVVGGPQERDRRGGTENVPGIVGLGVAADLARQFLADPATRRRLEGLRDRLEQAVLAAVPDSRVNAAGAPRLWNTSNLAFPHLEAEAIVVALSEREVCVSAGAACSSGSLEPSPVLLAMGLPPPVAHGSVRFSLSRHTTAAEIDGAVAVVAQEVKKLRQQFSFARVAGHGGTIEA